MNNKKILISIGLSLLLIGCGSDSKSEDTDTSTKISVPSQIDVAVPKALKSDKDTTKNKFQKTEDEIPETANSGGFFQLQSNIAEAEFMKTDLKINLLLAEKIMPQIQQECVDIPVGTTCDIEADKLSFVLDTTMINEINEITGEEAPPESMENVERTIKLGKTSFTQYDQSEEHQYALIMDMTPVENSFGSSVQESIQTIKWSKDENNVWSTYSTSDNSSKSNMSLRYLKKANGEVEMEIDDNYEGTTTQSIPTTLADGEDATSPVHESNKIKGEFNFKIVNANENFKITSNSSDYEDEKRIGTTSSIGEISDKGGYLSFRGFFFETEYREKEQFDGSGNIVSSIYCDSEQSCNLNDESTWIKNDTQSTSGSEPIIDIPQSSFVELIITGGNLKEGQTLLLKPDTNIDNLTMDNIFNSVIGEIYVSENETFGMLDSKDYVNQLEQLIMVHLDFDMEENINEDVFKEPTFEVVTTENRPTLTTK